MTHLEKIVGIIGGMGPEATVDLMQRIIELTPARDDIDHIRCIVDNNPKIPSRVRAIIRGDGESPAPCLSDMAHRLESWGADFLAIPCNTAHHYYDAVADAVNIPVINMIESVVHHVKTDFPDCKKIGLLASTAVLMTGLYEKGFEKEKAGVIYPSSGDQKSLMDIIMTVKAGKFVDRTKQRYQEVIKHLEAQDVDLLIIACTELGVISKPLPQKMIDAIDILAKEIVRTAIG